VKEINVKAGQTVKQGDILGAVDTTNLQRTADQAEADLLSAQDELNTLLKGTSELDMLRLQLAVAQAETALAQARKTKADLLKPDLAKLQRAVRNAEYDLEVARLNLELAKINTSVGKTVRDLQYAVAWHERNVRDIAAKRPGSSSAAASQSASANLLQAASPAGFGRPSPEPMTLEEAQKALADARQQLALAELNAAVTLANAQNRVTTAEKSLATAKENLANALAGPDAVALLQADSAIVQAEYKLAKAQDDLKTAQAGPNPKKVELAQAKVAAAKATLAQAQTALNNAVLKAPFAGVIISVKVKVGDDVSASRVAFTLADLTQFQVVAYVDETKISQVKVGQPARITFDALPGQTFKGEVLEVPIQGTLSQNVVNYAVTLKLENPQGLTLKPGLTANVTISLGSKQNVLLLPAYAVSQTADGMVVQLQESNGATTPAVVETGLNNGSYVEIVRGLNEGDKVVATYTQPQQQTQQRQGGAAAGGNIMIFGAGRR